MPVAVVDEFSQRLRKLIKRQTFLLGVELVEDEKHHGLLEVALELLGAHPQELVLFAETVLVVLLILYITSELLALRCYVRLRKLDGLFDFICFDDLNQLLLA